MLGQLHRATLSCPPPSVWGKRDKKGGPARGSKRTFVRFVSAFDPSPAQTCAGFGVKRTARGRAGRARLSSPGPPVGGRNQKTPDGHLAPFPPNPPTSLPPPPSLPRPWPTPRRVPEA